MTTYEDSRTVQLSLLALKFCFLRVRPVYDMCYFHRQYTIDPDHEILIFFRDFENHLPDSVSRTSSNVVPLSVLLIVGFV